MEEAEGVDREAVGTEPEEQAWFSNRLTAGGKTRTTRKTRHTGHAEVTYECTHHPETTTVVRSCLCLVAHIASHMVAETRPRRCS